MKLLEKLFCGHEWVQHTKVSRSCAQVWQVNYEDILLEHKNTTEILICKLCGKIKKITY